jgi:hypothetical protein
MATPETSPASRQRWSSPLFYIGIASLVVAGVIAGAIAVRVFIALWEHVASHDQQLALHQNSIQQLRGTRSALLDQAGHLKSLDTSTAALLALLERGALV